MLKALSLGAKACSGGRLYLYALAAAGQAGVAGAAAPVANAEITVEEEVRPMFLFQPGIDLREIVDAVNGVGASPSSLIAILEALKSAGSLRAELVVI